MSCSQNGQDPPPTIHPLIHPADSGGISFSGVAKVWVTAHCAFEFEASQICLAGPHHSVVIQLNGLRQTPPSSDFVAPFHPGLALLAFLWAGDLCPGELDLHVVFGEVPATRSASLIRGQSPACLGHQVALF